MKYTTSSASDGNALEAANLVLHEFDNHHVNRDLSRTGQLIVLISSGVGVFSLPKLSLAHITRKRLNDNGIALDLICLSNPPLHSVPVLKYMKTDKETKKV